MSRLVDVQLRPGIVPGEPICVDENAKASRPAC